MRRQAGKEKKKPGKEIHDRHSFRDKNASFRLVKYCRYKMVSLLIKLLLVACVAKAFQNLPLRGKLRPHSEGSQSSSSSGIVGWAHIVAKESRSESLLNVHWGS